MKMQDSQSRDMMKARWATRPSWYSLVAMFTVRIQTFRPQASGPAKIHFRFVDVVCAKIAPIYPICICVHFGVSVGVL